MKVAPVETRGRLRHCRYCGGRAYRGPTCQGHRDLPAIERSLGPRDQWRLLRKRAA